MTKTRTARCLAAIAALCVLVLTFSVSTAFAASYSKVYGKTTERVRVRQKASTNATVIDNIVKDACVYVTDSETSGSNTFVQVKYRASDGTVATGWLCQSDGSTTYVRIITNDSAKSSYGVSGGNVPSKVVGTFTSAQRESAQKTASSSYIGTGSSGSTVRDVQTKLKALGFYSGDITGNVGTKTEAAIKAFQQRYGLTADGIAGPQTVAKIDAVYASSGKSAVTGTSGGNIKLGSSGTDVAQLQRDLKTLGYYAAEITGSVGAKTQTAIKEFQRKNGLSADGVAGNKTLAAIAAAVGRSSSSGSMSTSETLRLNSSGSSVSALQQNLTALGIYSAEVTGHYGSKTEAAVRKFQQSHGLNADGIAGPKTLTAIASAVGGKGGSAAGSISGTLKEGSSGSDVTTLQNMLKALGYYYGEVTGHYGSLTKKAVKKFQEDNNLTVDGIAGAGTINRLRSLTGTSASGSGSNVATGNSYGRITKDNVKLRTSYSTSSEVRTSLDKGTLLRITKVVAVGSVNWYYVTVSTGGYTYKGYVRGDMMETITAAQYSSAGGDADEIVGDMETLGVLRVKGTNVRLRSGPDTTYGVVEHADAGDILYFVDYQDGWFETRSGLWINEDYVTELKGDEALRYLAGTSSNSTYRRGDSGPMVEWIQQVLEALEFYGENSDRGGSITGNFGAKTEDAVKDFQDWQNLPRTGVVDSTTLAAMRKAYAGDRTDLSIKPVQGKLYSIPWFPNTNSDSNKAAYYKKAGLTMGAGKNQTIALTDLNTGYSMYVYVQAVGNHADMEPLTQTDTNALCDMFGVSAPSQISYRRRAAMLTIFDGNKNVTYQFPCAIYGESHGADTIPDNGYSGQFCVHFLGTRTNGSNYDNPDNREVVKQALDLLKTKYGVTADTSVPAALK